MQTAQIKSAAVEVLEQIANDTKPANEILNAYTRSRRYIGSKDRKMLADIVWGYLRAFRRLDFDLPQSTVADKIDAVLTGKYTDKYAPAQASDAVRWEVPDWLVALIPDAKHELPALLGQADTILRANGNRQHIQQILLSEGIETEITALSPFGLKLNKRVNIQGTQAYRQGLVEVQDEGSQCVALETGIKPHDIVLDYCAGAGGKSLIFAQMMKNTGKIIAHDISDKSLVELQKRAKRAQATSIQTQKPLRPFLYDHVVVDAPCSGSGTWRRCPDMRLKLTQEQFQSVLKKQKMILNEAKQFVRPQGFLSYMTCSITEPENDGQIKEFLKCNSDFKLIKSRQFSPYQTQTDGLFVAVLQRQ